MTKKLLSGSIKTDIQKFSFMKQFINYYKRHSVLINSVDRTSYFSRRKVTDLNRNCKRYRKLCHRYYNNHYRSKYREYIKHVKYRNVIYGTYLRGSAVRRHRSAGVQGIYPFAYILGRRSKNRLLQKHIRILKRLYTSRRSSIRIKIRRCTKVTYLRAR
jgi:translation elongation factor EF-G